MSKTVACLIGVFIGFLIGIFILLMIDCAVAGPATHQFSQSSNGHDPLPKIVFNDNVAPKPKPDPRRGTRCARGPRTVVIAYPNNGGAAHWGDRLRTVNASLDCGDNVRFTDVCVSACTLWLKAKASCADTGDVRFFFHAVHTPRGDVIARETRELYREFPAFVKKAIDTHGGLRKDYFFITADELGIKRC